jgi:hypothetical protein
LHAETTQLLSETSKELAQKGAALRERLQGESTGAREKAQIERELENYRRSINLVSYARYMGYNVRSDVKLRHATVMYRADDTIVITTDRQGRGVYASTNREKVELPGGKIKFQHEDGDIIDFARKRLGVKDKELRMELAPWLTDKRGWHRQPERKYLSSPDMIKNAKDYATLVKKYNVWGLPPHESKYLTDRLGIGRESDRRFEGVIKSDVYGNSMFAHTDKRGEICGYDYRGVTKQGDKEISRFSRGGQLGLWKTANVGTAEKIVITSSGIDALSHAQLKDTGQETAYISVGDRNKLSKAQEEHVKETLRREGRRGAEIAIATNKGSGDIVRQLKHMSPEGAKIGRVVVGASWHELLQRKLQHERETAEQERRNRLREKIELERDCRGQSRGYDRGYDR